MMRDRLALPARISRTRADCLSIPMNAANYSSLIGPVKCPSCGWDDEGELRIVNLREECPFRWVPAHRKLTVWGGDPREHTSYDTSYGITLCPACDEDFSDPAAMARR